MKMSRSKKVSCLDCGFPCIIFRSTNTYGKRYNHNFVVEHIIYDMLEGEEEILMGEPDSVRDFLYVDDEAEANTAIGLLL